MNTNIYDVLPQGRLSAKKLKQLVEDANAMLTAQNAVHFLELGQRYNYYAIDVLGVTHKAWRDGDKTGASGIARTFDCGLNAKQTEQTIIRAYHEFVNEVN